MDAKKCADCGTEFGLTTWKYVCFRCGDCYCANHFTATPVGEAGRRFGGALKAAATGEGVCRRCDSQRVTTVKDGWRDPIAVGDALCLWPRADCAAVIMPLHFREAAQLPLGDKVCHVLVPAQPWDSALWLLREDADKARALVDRQNAPETWGKLFASGAAATPSEGTESQTESFARLAKFLENVQAWQRARWQPSDLDDRLAWLQATGAGTPIAGTAVQLAQMSHDIVAAQAEPPPDGNGAAIAVAGGVAALGAARLIGAAALRTAFPWIGLATGAVAVAATLLEDDPPIRKLLKRIKEASHEKDFESARKIVRAGALELDKAARDNGIAAENRRSLYHVALAGLLIWLADGRNAALSDAADCPDPVPLAVALAGATLKSTEPLQRFLASQRGTQGEFPWDDLVRRLSHALTDADHWTRRPIGRIQRGQRLSRGATKEVFSLVDRDDVVVAVQLPRQSASVRREVDLLLELARQTGKVGAYLGLQQVVQAGYWQEGDKKRIAFLTPRLTERPKNSAWPAARTAVEAGVCVGRTLQVLHRLRFVHGDVKPTNVLWAAAGNAVLIDYGGAIKLTTDESAIAVSRTDAFAAPEVAESGRITTASDVFALARTLVQWLAEAADAPTRVDAASHHTALLDCLEDAQRREPKARPTLERLLAVLEIWLVQHGQPKTRLTAVEETVRLHAETFAAKLRTRPADAVMAELQRALRTMLLPPTGQPDEHHRAVAQLWTDFARTLVREELWLPWVAVMRQSEPVSAVVQCLTVTDAMSHETAGVVRGLRAALEGTTTVMPQILLSQSAVFVGKSSYRPLQHALLVWLNHRGPIGDLQALAKLLRKIGDLRNAIQHGSKDDTAVYGRVQSGVLVMTALDVDTLRRDVAELAALVMGRLS